MKDRIQISQDTADILFEGELSRMIRKREDVVTAKGKGQMQTYWLLSKMEQSTSEHGGKQRRDEHARSSMKKLNTHDYDDEPVPPKHSSDFMIDDKEARLIGWNVEILSRLLKQIVAMRDEKDSEKDWADSFAFDDNDDSTTTDAADLRVETQRPLDEVQEIIALPSTVAKYNRDPEKVQLSNDVKRQLKSYVQCIADMYRENPFHSFEHASHVTMSTVKLLTRIVAPATIDYSDMCYKDKENAKLHDHTYGIVSSFCSYLLTSHAGFVCLCCQHSNAFPILFYVLYDLATNLSRHRIQSPNLPVSYQL